MEDAYPRTSGIKEDENGTKPLLKPFSDSARPNAAIASSDDELFIRRTLEDNPRLGLELLYKRYYQPMCTHAVKFVGAREVAEDLVSEIFFSFYSNNTFIEINTSYRLYLFRTVRNRAYNYLRWDLGRKAELSEAAQKPILKELQPDQISQFEELYHDVEEAVNKLPASAAGFTSCASSMA